VKKRVPAMIAKIKVFIKQNNFTFAGRFEVQICTFGTVDPGKICPDIATYWVMDVSASKEDSIHILEEPTTSAVVVGLK
jgi:hypothetical protein